jgi:hypothetical protein
LEGQSDADPRDGKLRKPGEGRLLDLLKSLKWENAGSPVQFARSANPIQVYNRNAQERTFYGFREARYSFSEALTAAATGKPGFSPAPHRGPDRSNTDVEVSQ